jgi:hypothetical protein
MTGPVTDVLEHAYAQSYGKFVPAEIGPFPVLPRWEGERFELPRDLLAPLTTIAWPRSGAPARGQVRSVRQPPPAGGPATGRPGLATWPTVLVGTWGLQRREPGHRYNDHRSYPSPRCLYPTAALVRNAGGWFGYDPAAHVLVRLTGPGAPDLTGPATLMCACRPGQLPAGYGSLRLPLAMLEAGHAAATATMLARALGESARIGTRPVRGPLDGDFTPAFQLRLPGARPAPPASPLSPVSQSVADVLFQRHSGRSPRGLGLTATMAPIPAEVIFRAAASPRSCTGIQVRLLVATERVSGLADGLYEAGRSDLTPLRRGRMLGLAQAAVSYPAIQSVTMASFNAVWFLVVDYPAIVSQHGQAGFRRAQLELGARAQDIGLSLAADGCFARPIRSFHEPVLDDLLGLRPAQQVGYVLLTGRSRCTDLLLDLRV